MLPGLFTELYEESFIPEVKKHQNCVRKEGIKVLLILDNASTHPVEESLERWSENFKTINFSQKSQAYCDE